MLKIRLQRFGKKNQAAFRVVLTDSRNSTKSGRFLEILGWHNPRLHKTELKKERILSWMKQGAQLTGTLNNMMVKQGVIKGKKIHVAPNLPPAAAQESSGEAKPAAPAEAEAKAPETPAAEAPAPAEEVKKVETPVA